jgi:hypothetical protein
MTHGADIIRPGLDAPGMPAEAQRKALLFQMLMAEGIAQLIRHRLSTAPRHVPGSACPALLLITQLRQSGMAHLTHDPQGLHLSMHGYTVNAPTPRGVLWEWSNAVLGRGT